MSKLIISLVGPYPPPYGGISVHIQRLINNLERNNIKFNVYAISKTLKEDRNIKIIGNNKRSWILLIKQLLFDKSKIIHYHGFFNYDPVIISVLSLILLKKKIIVTFHSFRSNLDNLNLMERIFFFVNKIIPIYFISVGPEIKEKLILLGVREKYIEVIPAFIPPIIKNKDIVEIPEETWNFISNHRPVISGNASGIAFFNNQDLYGIDMCIDLCTVIKNYYPNIGFVFALSNIEDYVYLNNMKQQIIDKGLEDNFIFQIKPCQLYPILIKSDLFVRPTNTDGYSVSVAEALFFGIPAVASNVCLRPEGTILFESRNMDDFYLKVKDVLDNINLYKDKLNNLKIENNSDKIIKFYQRLIND